ncbi:tetratricopeptide repeat protein [Lignipirellula cremea]|uniref:Uncharacterized protein n=1 Tax=Lignipirellula cremea TaxID=2528010 RepID=A0A518DYV7_9BACT|nr:tetratricopeptide repeat protein [Lignipirellula cremea]QDU97026.1 hypothetical protein Pla8534_48510 [Lignipirellula cremea]
MFRILSLPSLLAVLLMPLAFSSLPHNLHAQPPQTNRLDAPRIQAFAARLEARAVQLLNQGDYDAAAQILQQVVKTSPSAFSSRYNLACVWARQGKTDQAFTELTQAIADGYRDAQHLATDPDLASLRDDPRWATLLKQAAVLKEETAAAPDPITPAEAADSQVLIGAENVAWSQQLGMFRVEVAFPAEPQGPIAVGLGESGDRLREWYEAGTAAGNHGDLYDNHDTDHSNMNYKALPQLTRVEFTDDIKNRGMHHGLQRFFLYNAPTIGNSSTAFTAGPQWRCQGRFALTSPGGPQLLYNQYRGNQLFFYPEHRDHDPGHNGKDGGYGDVLPANTPYLILSQGSSGSDRAFMLAVAQTMAALQPAVKKKLVEQGLLMPTVQWIFRHSNKMATTPEAYLTGAAHPTVFDGEQLDVLKMETLAHDLQPDALPPLALLQVVEETAGQPGVDYFDVAAREQLFTTPCAIARVVKSTKHHQQMTVSAADSIDPQGKPLTFRWVVLRGDPEKIQIRLLDKAGSQVELKIGYHPRAPISPGSKMESNRVDIGVFADNGQHLSAPSFLSFHYPDAEVRTYDDQQRILSVDYNADDVRGNYVDPVLDAHRNWRDEYQYSPAGELQGWTRIRGDQREQFTADGRLILTPADGDQPAQTTAVKYVEQRDNRQSQIVQQVVEPPAKDDSQPEKKTAGDKPDDGAKPESEGRSKTDAAPKDSSRP